jgi:hypothetical protein
MAAMPLTGDRFNPGDVYLYGTLMKGQTNPYGAIAHWSDPNQACVGFDSHFNEGNAAIRPTDGRLYYLNTNESTLRQFRMDLCGSPSVATYPVDPLANDSVVPTPKCGSVGISDFRFSPEGDLYYQCNNSADHSWLSDKTGAKVFDGSGRVRRIGLSQVALLEYGIYGGTFKIGNLATGTITDVAWSPAQPTINPDATRARDAGGFWIGFKNDAGSDAQLWQVTPDANATLVSSYPPPPPVNDLLGAGSALDGCLGLLQYGHNLQGQNIIIRRDTMGGSAIGFNASDGPLVQLGPASMLTAP